MWTTQSPCMLFVPTVSLHSTISQSRLRASPTSLHTSRFQTCRSSRISLRTLRVRTCRRRPLTPTCTFNNNRNRNNNYKIADVFIATGRFLQSPSGQVLLWGTLVWLVLTGRIGIIFDSFLILFAVLTVVPVVAMLGFRWWISRQLVQSTCSSCGATVTGLKGQAVNCAVCGTVFQTEKTGNFSVKDPSSATIDIDAREID